MCGLRTDNTWTRTRRSRHPVWLSSSGMFTCLFLLLTGCASSPPTIVETDPFDAAHRRLETKSHVALVEHAHQLLQSSHPDADEIQDVSSQLKQVLMESRVSKTGIKPKLRQKMEDAVSHLAHRASLNPPRYHKVTHPTTRSPNRASLSFAWPLKRVRVESSFGLRTDPFGSEKKLFHDGIDLAAPEGTPVHSPARGTVLQVGWRDNGCGLGITLIHEDAYMSDYCHLSKTIVVIGQEVSRGESIGQVGKTGRSQGPHLHWSVWKNGQAIDPKSVAPRVHQ